MSAGQGRLRLDLGGHHATIAEAGDAARAAQDAGFEGWWATETQLDPFLSCALAIERTQDIRIGTGIAVAFARNPMNVAMMANGARPRAHAGLRPGVSAAA